MKSLSHNGILVKEYVPVGGLAIYLNKVPILLGPESEEMAIAWCKKLGTEYINDMTFCVNFFVDFCRSLSMPDLTHDLTQNFDFSEVIAYLDKIKTEKEALTPEQKKQAIKDRKALKEAEKKKYGIAYIDGQPVEVSNYIAEPSSIFMGRGKHPKRGEWKPGPSQVNIVLNLSFDSPVPPGDWHRTWEPDSYWIAKWEDSISNKWKYVWISDSSPLKQDKEKAKYEKAKNLDIDVIRKHIDKNLDLANADRAELATVCALIDSFNLRVGDEKDADEADTIGAITLRPEHIELEDEGNGESMITLKFLGKDSVMWNISDCISNKLAGCIDFFIGRCNKFKFHCLFVNTTSAKVTKFLQEVEDGITAKVFRTYKATLATRYYLDHATVSKNDTEPSKVYHAKMGNLEAAKICNHKRKIPAKYEEILARKEDTMNQLIGQLGLCTDPMKKEKLEQKITKIEMDIMLQKAVKEYNLNTSLNSYISPEVYSKYCKDVQLDPSKIYSKKLLKKFSWAI